MFFNYKAVKFPIFVFKLFIFSILVLLIVRKVSENNF